MTSAFDAYRTTYEDVVAESIAFSRLDHGFFLDAKVRLLEHLFAKHFGARAPTLLDVGCGVGLLHRRLAGCVKAVAGTDLSAGSLARAAVDNPAFDYRLQVEDTLPWPASAFDASLAVCVFHHVPESRRRHLVAEMRRVTKPGGLVVLIEHNPWNLLTRVAVARCPFDHDAVLLGASRTRHLLAAEGLHSVESQHFLIFPIANRWTARAERALRHLPIGAQFAACGIA